MNRSLVARRLVGAVPRPERGTACVRLIALGLALGVGLGLGGCAPTERVQVEVLRLGHGLDEAHPVHRAMAHMATRLDALSGGAMRLEIYPSEQLGDERECLELLQLGSLGLTKVSASVLAGFAPLYRTLGLPYLFRDREHAFAVLDGPIGRRLLDASADQRLLGLAFYDAGSRSFYTRDRAIEVPEDLEGLKIRTQESAVAMAMVRALGGAPTPISWGELYTALQQGVVDGAENNPPSFHLSGHYEVARVYSLDEHTRVPDVLLVSTVVWQRLDARQQAWLREAAVESARVQRALWAEAEETALEAVEAAGVEIVRPDLGPFAVRTASILDGEAPDVAELAAAIRAQGAPVAGSHAAPVAAPENET
ncbi:MAG: TRAP transporter substrate-binding protein [Acidobacteriota bacterium]